ncbi:tetratricopeptide repeat protein [Actinoplanes sp. NPDC051859]|uniref:tetratricopeptide repeat protein n=1 Tax=Actinoplanes sp. NPDC051859 TaxID=3363909 RepID=UPI0037A09C85
MRRRERKAVERAVEQARRTGPADTAAALSDAGEAYREAGDQDEALHCFHQALALYGELDDVQGQLVVLTKVALVQRAAERFTDAADAYQQALALSVALDWQTVTPLLQLKVRAMAAAETAGIDVPDQLIESAASAGPGRMWVYEVDDNLVPKGATQIPAQAIKRGWEVDDGELTGLIIPNVNYRPR